MADIDDVELDHLRKGQALLDQLLKSPKTKRITEKAIKQLHPDTVISEDYDAPVLEEMRAIGEKVDKFLTQQAEAAADGETDKAFAQLRTEGYTDDGIDWIKKRMVDTKNPDPMAAAALYDKTHPPEPQRPAGFMGTGWGIGSKTDDKDLTLLFDDEEAWSDREAVKHFQEMEAKR